MDDTTQPDVAPDPVEGDDVVDDGPTVEEAKAVALGLVHEDLPEAADLPTDVKNDTIEGVDEA